MRRKSIAIITAVAAIVGWFVYSAKVNQQNELEIQRLAKRALQARQNERSQTEPDWAALYRQGVGHPVPATLVAKPDRTGDFWFVGAPNITSGVEVPFRPGRLPTPSPSLKPLEENPGFLGADACESCHQEKHDSFIQTAHHLTSRKANIETIAGSFQPGRNQLKTSDQNVQFTMVQREGTCFQRVKFYDWQFEVPFDLVTGSSKMAQTFLYWDSNKLYQMNVTYLASADGWINSPGYVDGDAAYARPIGPRCVECHTTYADFRGPPNRFTPDSIIVGISCERCHGPGRDHVQYHLANPDDKLARHVSVPSDLTRQQQIDICNQCHAGVSKLKGKPYQFRPGDELGDHYHPLDTKESANKVHTANQSARLALSECFKQSTMACVECHDPHHNERGQMELFSSRCLKCHESQHCGMSGQLGERLNENCVDCHMPKRAGDHLRFETAEGKVFPALRDHHIRVDPQATEEYLKQLSLATE